MAAALSDGVKTVTLQAGEDLNGDLYEALTIDSSGQVIKPTATNLAIVGFLAEDPTPSQGSTVSSDLDYVTVALLQGICLVKAGGNVTAGNLAISDNNGRLINGGATVGALAADVFSPGVFLDSGADGQIVRLLAQPMTSATET